MVVDRFPYVGSWRSVHFLLALFSQVGEGILRALGECVFTWRALRVVSLGLRHGVASALVEVLRRSCWARYFEGPQWQLAVDRYMVTGRVVEETRALNASLGGQQGVSSEGPVFPYVEGPPGYASHYLWRVFMLAGWLVLDFLGDRMSSWGYLRSTAEGFRSGATMAVSIWLRRTGQRYIDRYLAPTPTTADAVQAYMERGELQFPFADRNNQNPEGTDVEDDEHVDERVFRGHRPDPVAPLGGLGLAGRELFESSSSESEDSGESTTEPSVVSVSSRSSVSERDNGSVEVESRDDCSIPGSSSDTPQEVVQGRWRFRGLRGFLEGIRGILWSLFVLWFLVQGVRAQAEGEGLQVVLRDSSELYSCAELGWPRRAKPENAVLLTGWDSCDGSVLWEVVKMIVLIWIWETGRCCIRGRSPIRNHGQEVATQTSGLNVVPLPLKKGVPNRSDILFALWKAGYQVDVDAPEYSEGVRSRFYSLMGGYLSRLEFEGDVYSEMSSSEGSGGQFDTTDAE